MDKGETIRLLARHLKAHDVDQGTALTISLSLRKPGKAEKMIEWLEKNPTATPETVCQKAWEISDEKQT